MSSTQSLPPRLCSQRSKVITFPFSRRCRPFTNVFADTFDGNTFASIKVDGGCIERCEQGCLFRNIRNIGPNLLTKPNQFADLANLFFERQLREFVAHLGFHEQNS